MRPEKLLVDAIDGERSIGEIAGDSHAMSAALCSSGSGGTIRSCLTDREARHAPDVGGVSASSNRPCPLADSCSRRAGSSRLAFFCRIRRCDCRPDGGTHSWAGDQLHRRHPRRAALAVDPLRPRSARCAGFDAANESLGWALSGFANSTVWLIFGAFTFALGYEKTGLGRRLALLLVRAMGHRTVTLGYAVVAADALMAPFTPSSTARSGGTVYPAIRNLPSLYGSMPNDPSRRLLGSYLMWTALAAVNVTSSMFLTGMAPNLLAVELVAKSVDVQITWMMWFVSFAPLGIVLLLALPWLVYVLYPPTITKGTEVVSFAAEELRKLGRISKRESLLMCLSCWHWSCGPRAPIWWTRRRPPWPLSV